MRILTKKSMLVCKTSLTYILKKFDYPSLKRYDIIFSLINELIFLKRFISNHINEYKVENPTE